MKLLKLLGLGSALLAFAGIGAGITYLLMREDTEPWEEDDIFDGIYDEDGEDSCSGCHLADECNEGQYGYCPLADDFGDYNEEEPEGYYGEDDYDYDGYDD